MNINIEAFLLCDAATDQQGKLNVLGAFDTIFVKQMPAVHPACAVAARIRFPKSEEGNHKVRIDVIDQDGGAIIPRLDGNLSVNVKDAVSSAVNLVLNMQRLKFKNYGEYNVVLAIDGKEESSLPFHVREIPNQTKLQKNINNE